MTTNIDDTIYALASGQLPAGIAVVRISGPQCRFVCETMCSDLPEARRAMLRKITTADGAVIDRGLVSFFPKPDSFTGEDVLELHLHGGKAVVAAVFGALHAMDGLRPAEAGEFTMRAFQNGKIDLTEAEALADLIDAETEEQRRFALANYGDAHRTLYENWRSRIVDSLAEMTAAIDFADEADVAETLDPNMSVGLHSVVDEIDSHMKRFHAGEIIREGYRVAIIGAPNSGKSSLLNAIAGRDVAIVTDEPGTTRDVLEVALDLNGYKIVMSDTAGIRENAGKVEAIGIARAKDTAELADMVLLVEDAGRPVDHEVLQDLKGRFVRVANKIDIRTDYDPERYDVCISARAQTGLDNLMDNIAREASEAAGFPSVIPFRRRHVGLLGEARDALVKCVEESRMPVELRAEELRRAAEAIGRLTGSVDVEDLLDVIFSRFCVGK